MRKSLEAERKKLERDRLEFEHQKVETSQNVIVRVSEAQKMLAAERERCEQMKLELEQKDIESKRRDANHNDMIKEKDKLNTENREIKARLEKTLKAQFQYREAIARNRYILREQLQKVIELQDFEEQGERSDETETCTLDSDQFESERMTQKQKMLKMKMTVLSERLNRVLRNLKENQHDGVGIELQKLYVERRQIEEELGNDLSGKMN